MKKALKNAEAKGGMKDGGKPEPPLKVKEPVVIIPKHSP